MNASTEPLGGLPTRELGLIEARGHAATTERLDRLRDAVHDISRRLQDIESVLDDQFALKSSVSSVLPYVPKPQKKGKPSVKR